VFQGFSLFPHLTALENVALAPRVALGLPAAVSEQRARALLKQLGLAAKANAYPDSLSGGQQQRVAIARALATEPKVLLLDEITSALDPVLVADVLEALRALAKGGATMLIATHEMAFAADVADRICYLEGGRIVEQGSPEKIFGAPRDPRTRAFLKRVRSVGASALR
jgi:polar amino acid transport system ATP-binding protein